MRSFVLLVMFMSVLTLVTTPIVAQAQENGSIRPIQDVSKWERSRENLIYKFNNMYQPCVVERSGEEFPYLMWFFGWSTADANPDFAGCDAIFHARSKDLRHWEVYCGDAGWDGDMKPARWRPVLTASDRYYDAWHNGDPSVVWKDGAFFMAYSATSKPFCKKVKDHCDGVLMCVMGATSADGIRWTKTDQPLLVESKEVEQAETDTVEACDFHRPSLLWDEGKWKLWFDYWCPPNGVCLGYSENTGEFGAKGGFQLKHDPKAPLIKCWTNPAVVKVNGKYHCFADPPGYPPTVSDTANGRMWSTRQLCEAVSEDGLHWTIVGFIPPDDGVSACHVPQPLVTKRDGREWLYLFYATQKGLRFRLNPGEDYDYRYDSIRAMRRGID